MQNRLNKEGRYFRSANTVRVVPVLASLALLLGACSSGNSNPPASDATQQVMVNELSQNDSVEQTNNQTTDQTTGPITDQTNNTTTEQSQNPDWLLYQDSSVQLRYPPQLTLVQNLADVTAQFLDPTPNSLGGNDNCTYTDSFEPGTSLVEQTDLVLELLYDETPDPDVDFLDVNGKSAVRIDGNVTFGGISAVRTRLQILYSQDTVHALACFGLSDDDVNGIFDSFTLLN